MGGEGSDPYRPDEEEDKRDDPRGPTFAPITSDEYNLARMEEEDAAEAELEDEALGSNWWERAPEHMQSDLQVMAALLEDRGKSASPNEQMRWLMEAQRRGDLDQELDLTGFLPYLKSAGLMDPWWETAPRHMQPTLRVLGTRMGNLSFDAAVFEAIEPSMTLGALLAIDDRMGIADMVVGAWAMWRFLDRFKEPFSLGDIDVRLNSEMDTEPYLPYLREAGIIAD